MGMTVSMHVMHVGDGFRYLLRSVVAADGNRSLSMPLTRYYAATGTPPGRWLGSGLGGFGVGELRAGDQVTEAQLARLLGVGRDPVTGAPLGRAFGNYRPGVDHDCDPEAEANPSSGAARRGSAGKSKGRPRAVAGFDFTFSVPKSVSVVWGVADARIQELIVGEHHAAVDDVISLLEREVAATRVGMAAHDGSVAQVDVDGVAAAAFDHWDSRVHDPQLHTHVVISNKARAVLDGRWRSLDSRPLHSATVALSELYNAVLADRLTSRLGVGWEPRERGTNRNPAWEIADVPHELVEEFSNRSRAIEIEKDRLIEQYIAEHGKKPSARTIVKLRAQATLETRPEKQVRSLADLTSEWRDRATKIIGGDATDWAGRVITNGGATMVGADDISRDQVHQLGASVVAVVGEKRSTWTHWNLFAEACRQAMGWRFTTPAARETVINRIVAAAEQQSVRLTPPELAISPTSFRRDDGSSVFRPRHSTVYTSTATLDAEDRLLARSEDLAAPIVKPTVVSKVITRAGDRLTGEQIDVATSIATSGRRLDVLVGPAGSGKTTTLRALRRAWTTRYGRGSVTGLAPSAAAAQVLGDELEIECENTAKWLYDHGCGRLALRPDQLVIIDEATLADTRTLDRVTSAAEVAGAKALLVGDWAQLSAVDAGGAFAMLVEARPDAPELTQVHRLVHDWEKKASLSLRAGDTGVIDIYLQHDRVREGLTDDTIGTAYKQWFADVDRGLDSVLVTQSADTMRELNARARADRLLTDTTQAGREATLSNDASASVGDVIITRRNDRRIRDVRGGWVHNGDRWRVTDALPDGSLRVDRRDGRWGTGVILPADYVAEHVDLGYAVTAHRAQGVTVDTCHAVVTPSTTRENFYVAMTRGRRANTCYVTLDQPDEDHRTPPDADVSARSVLYGVLKHSGAELSAHQTITAEHEKWSSISQLVAEYETIATAAQRSRWETLVQQCGLTPEQADEAIASSAFGPLTAALRRAEAYGHDVDKLLPALAARRSLDDADDVAAVLHHRLTASLGRQGRRARQKLIVGLIPEAGGQLSDDNRRALDERRDLIESRAKALAQDAIEAGERWVRDLGTRPEPTARGFDNWLDQIEIIAAYRDRWDVSDLTTLGTPAESDIQRLDAACARAAMRRARSIADVVQRSRAARSQVATNTREL